MMNRGITFTDFHTAIDWGLILTAKSIPRAEIKENYVEIDGRDGALDYTEAFGDVKYKNRPLSFSFSASDGTYLEREELINKIVQLIHGKRHMIITDDDPQHYFVGRCKVENITNGLAYGTFQISVTADPWRYAREKTYLILPAKSYQHDPIRLYNQGRKTCVPTVTVAAAASIYYGSTVKELKKGTYILPDLILTSGVNQIYLTSESKVMFEWQEADL